MKIQITEQDIKTMTEACVKQFLREWYDDDPKEYISLYDALYNPLTGEVEFVPRDYGGFGQWKAYKDKMAQRAIQAGLGDGWIWSISFDVEDCSYEDTSFSYAIGMDSGVHNEGYYYPTEVSISDEYPMFYIQNGQVIEPEGDEPEELEPEQRAYILKYANENVESLQY